MKFENLLEACGLDMQAGVPDIQPDLTPFEEPEHQESESENMIQSQLSSIIRNTSKLQMLSQRFETLEPWVQAKITLAEDYVNTIANYLEFEASKTANKIEPPVKVAVAFRPPSTDKLKVPPAGRIEP